MGKRSPKPVGHAISTARRLHRDKGLQRQLGISFDPPPIADEDSFDRENWEEGMIDAPDPTMSKNKSSRGAGGTSPRGGVR